MSKQKRVSFTRTVRELKKVRLEMESYVEQGSTKQVGVELELQENSLSDVVADTHESRTSLRDFRGFKSRTVMKIKLKVELN